MVSAMSGIWWLRIDIKNNVLQGDWTICSNVLTTHGEIYINTIGRVYVVTYQRERKSSF